MKAARTKRARGPTAVELLEKRVQALQLLHDTGRRMVSLLDMEALLPEMVEQLRAVLRVEIVSIMLLDETRLSLRIAAAAGLPDAVVRAARVPLGEGISGQAAARGEAILIRDMASHPEFRPSPHASQYSTGSLLCVPLRIGDRVLGVINVNNKLTGEPLDDEDLALVTTFSSQAALAVENSRLYGHLESEVALVTEQLRRSNLELRRMQEFTESILTHMSSGLLVLDLEGRVTRLNAAGAAILNVPAAGGAAPSGDPVSARVALPAPAEETLETLFGPAAAPIVLSDASEAPHERREVMARSRHGREVLLGFSTSPLLEADGRRAGLIVIFRDLTHLKKMEAELVRMDRMASLGVLGAGIAHEIRNPLAAIRFNLDFLREASTGAAEIDVIAKNVDRLDDLVRNLLRFARPQPPSFDARPLEPRVQSVVTLIGKQAAASGVRLVTRFAAGLPDAWIDGAQVEQVVLNVALNGIQAMPSGGELTLETRFAPCRNAPAARGRKSRTERRDEKGCVELLIHDQGVGLPEGAADRIFNPFYTTREEGTGLGLAVAHRIMADHGGYIEVQPGSGAAGAGRGTTFVLGFPVASTRQEL